MNDLVVKEVKEVKEVLKYNKGKKSTAAHNSGSEKEPDNFNFDKFSNREQ